MENLKPFLTATEMSHVLKHALSIPNLINEDDTAIIWIDLTFLNNRIKQLKQAFPSSTTHTIALKANPLTSILHKMKALDVGIEVASFPEMYMAMAAGFEPEKIIFDSPSKTVSEIGFALKNDIHLNADSFTELERIDEILKTNSSKSIIGLRINPQVGSGSIKTTSVAGEISKFGVPITSNRLQLKEAFAKYKWLNAVHVHIGSQGCPVPLLIQGIKTVVDLVNEINDELNQQDVKRLISVVDIGGGLPVTYYQDEKVVSIQHFYDQLQSAIPELFSGKFRVITEFGRYIHANSGWVSSRVELVKREKKCAIAMIHVGADLLLRECYNPQDWHHEISVTDTFGNLKNNSDKNNYMIAGPLCFSGDVIARDLQLPVIEENDFILIHDTGAYTFSMWSRYNSRQMPKVIGYSDNGAHFEILKERESLQDVANFWS
ncbi:MAG: diaminopimelate decarboxylase [Bacteroidetes bacterium]|nr:MAG: diaminopimelate decarboxylase [Bacteroidota bacterium]